MKKFYYLLVLLFSFQSAAKAAEEIRTLALPGADSVFLEMPAAQYPVNADGLPIYATTEKIGFVPAGTTFKVDLAYPEYAVLNANETKWAKKFEQQIKGEIKINTHLGFSRKEGYLDLAFCPIIKKNDKFYRLTSCKIKINSSSRNFNRLATLTTENSRWKSNSVLQKGKWAKLRVKAEGIYTLTPAFLSKMGFNDPSKVKLFGYGGRILEEDWKFEQPGQVEDDLEEIPLYRKEDGNALFFAEGTVRWTFNNSRNKWIHENNPYSKYSYYFITEGDNPASLEELEAINTPTDVISEIPYHAVLDNDAFGWYSGGREMYDGTDLSYSSQHTFKIKAPGIVASTDYVYENIDIAFSAASILSSTIASVNLGEEFLGNISIPKFGNFQSGYEARKYFTSKQLSEENSFKIKISPSNPSRLNFIRINYTRKLKAADKPYSFTPNSNKPIQLNIEGANENTQLWRIDNYGFPAVIVPSSLSGDTLQATIDEGKQRYVVVNVNDDFPTPEWDGKVENQNLHGDSCAYDMIILIPESKKLLSEAERLAEAHRNMQGLRVKIVDAGQIYNEFSSGTPDATAYRRYMKMLYDRAETPKDLPRYLLLFGDCAWDNRMITDEFRGYSTKDFLLSFEVTDGFNDLKNNVFALGEQDSYVTDDYFGWLDDAEGSLYTLNKLDLGIGRFPCVNSETAKIFVDKSIEYLENKNTGAWKNKIYVLADNGNANLHMEDAERVVKEIETQTNSSSVIKKVYNDAYERIASGTGYSFPTVNRILKDAMQEGALVFNYTGHGNPEQLSHSVILKTEDFKNNITTNLPLWIMASCEISPYDSRKQDLGRTALENPQGGAIAVMCASRAVFSNYNLILNMAYNKYIFSYDENGKRNTMGDAMRLTKVDLVTPSQFGGIKDGSINKLKYTLLGDPALTLSIPTGKVTVDSINGIETKNLEESLQLKAGSLVRFSGSVCQADGEYIPNFNGSITATMNDRLETIICKNNDRSADVPMEFKDRTKKIFEGSDSVRNGKFSIQFRIPKDISYSLDNGRITFYAVNNERNLECHGSNEQFFLNGTDNTFAEDTLAPQVYLYLNTPDFPDGGVVAPNPVFFAKIKDDAGINATGISAGHDMELVIDHDYTSPISLNNRFNYVFGSYNEGLTSYPIENLGFGAHHISFRVWDVNGNSTTKQLKFFIQDGVKSTFDVYASENPATTQTNLITTFVNEEGIEHQATFVVYNLNGQKVWQSAPITLPANSSHGLAEWRLTSGDGARVPAGIYLYKVILQSEQGKQESKAKKLIVSEQ